LRHTNVIVLTDETEFARLLTACWQAERHVPAIAVLNSELWLRQQHLPCDLLVIGPIQDGLLSSILLGLDPSIAVILCSHADHREYSGLRSRYPRFTHIPLREDWAQTLLLVAGESLRRVKAMQLARTAQEEAAQNARDAVLGKYMASMQNGINNALTSVLGNAELLLLEPGQLSAQSRDQLKTIHSMALRINEVMQRFSSLVGEIRSAETESHTETVNAPAVSLDGG
jgi:signal transduction histidine kinase